MEIFPAFLALVALLVLVPADARYSLAYFAQANRDVVIRGPQRRYPAITAADYLAQRIAANFG